MASIAKTAPQFFTWTRSEVINSSLNKPLSDKISATDLLRCLSIPDMLSYLFGIKPQEPSSCSEVPARLLIQELKNSSPSLVPFSTSHSAQPVPAAPSSIQEPSLITKLNLKRGRPNLSTRPSMNEVAEYFGTAPCWQDHCNVLHNKPRGSKITFTELRNYLNGNKGSFQEVFNWIRDRDLYHPITAAEIDNHPWKSHVNAYFGQPLKAFVGKEQLEKCLGRKVTVEEHINCNLDRALSHLVSEMEVSNYLDGYIWVGF